MKAIVLVTALFLFCLGCTSPPSNEMSQQQKDQITNELKAAGDSLIAAFERLDVQAALQFYAESPDWKMFNADGSAYDYQTNKKFLSDWANSTTSYKWTTTRQDFIIVTKDFVICAWVGKDETLMKSGDKVTYDPHAYTLVYKKIAGQWKVIYQQDSGIAVTHKAAKK